VYKTGEREVFLDFFRKPYLYELPIAFYYLTKNPVNINMYADLSALPLIGVLRNAKYFSRFDNDATLKKYEVNAQELLYPMLLSKRISAFAGYVPTENYFISKNGYQGIIVHSSFVFNDHNFVYFAMSKKPGIPDCLQNSTTSSSA
jgi:ABC-type amino acid transport substrate-binding protein